MGYRNFGTGLVWRIGLLTLTALATAWFTFHAQQDARQDAQPSAWALALGLGLNAIQATGLYRYVAATNRKLTRFLESVRYSDFAISFRSDNGLGQSFQDLNQQFNEVLEAFRQARAEKEANLHYLNALVQHVSVGLLSFDAVGNVDLVNQAALRLLGTYRLRNLGELQASHPTLLALLKKSSLETRAETRSEHGSEARTDSPAVYRPGTAPGAAQEQAISIRLTTLRLRGRLVTLVSLQNIHAELQQKELEAWQNLTKVLRHEIMNSLTPVVSLVGTMQQIVQAELSDGHAPAASVNDLTEALATIEHRGRGIMRFVDAYRHFTTLPPARLAEVPVATLLHRVTQLIQPELQQRRITLRVTPPPSDLLVLADAGQLEMVLLNLIRNAAESTEVVDQPLIRVEAEPTGERQIVIRVSDNGPGIEPEALEKVFIPFYTTKKTGSGIGLSLSRQIIHQHGGHVEVLAAGPGCTIELRLRAAG
ncbi:MAG: histidine kinase [Cytophagaceae bacterium]|nr:histidine kinase [Cytophagaceae bacterium]